MLDFEIGKLREGVGVDAIAAAVDWSAIEAAFAPYRSQRIGDRSFRLLTLLKCMVYRALLAPDRARFDDAVNDRISCRRFIGLGSDEVPPRFEDVGAFAEEIQRRGIAARVAEAVSRQLGAKGLLASIPAARPAPAGPPARPGLSAAKPPPPGAASGGVSLRPRAELASPTEDVIGEAARSLASALAPGGGTRRRSMVAERQLSADVAVSRFALQQLDAQRAPLPPWRVERRRDRRDDARRDGMRSRMAGLWAAQAELVARAGTTPDKALDEVWAYYARKLRPATIGDLIRTVLVAEIAQSCPRNRREPDDFFGFYFSKMAPYIVEREDEDGNTLLHYLVLQRSDAIGRVLTAMHALIARRRGLDQAAPPPGDADAEAEDEGPQRTRRREVVTEQGAALNLAHRQSVYALFVERRNAAQECVMDLVARHADPATLAEAEATLAGMFAPGEEPVPGGSPHGTGLDRLQAIQSRPFDAADLDALLQGGDLRAQALYVRMFADSIEPAHVRDAVQAHRVDLFAIDLAPLALDPEQERWFSASKRVAFIPGALNNAYAKRGLVDPAFAQCKLVRERGRHSQGFCDARGYNVYMRMAESTELPDAYLANEHVFWDHVFTRIAKYMAARDEAGRSWRHFFIQTARDILDMPGNDGRTALHLAAIHGREIMIRYILERELDFSSAEALKLAMDERDHAAIEGRRNDYFEEMRINLAYLSVTDSADHSPWTYAILHGRRDVLVALVGTLERYPEYLEMLAQMAVRARLPGEPQPTDLEPGDVALAQAETTTLLDFAERAPATTAAQHEAQSYLRKILLEARQRLRIRAETSKELARFWAG
ncbi:MAG: hypothetical protein JNK11_18730 [Alphaproteobacteria bacterium]|nr:hypothetical protein [Alphaproteobacteria bacterium]